MANKLAVERVIMQSRVRGILDRIPQKDLPEALKLLYVHGGAMAICPLCWDVMGYRKDTIDKRVPGKKRPEKIHVCGNRVIRTSWERVRDWIFAFDPNNLSV